MSWVLEAIIRDSRIVNHHLTTLIHFNAIQTRKITQNKNLYAHIIINQWGRNFPMEQKFTL